MAPRWQEQKTNKNTKKLYNKNRWRTTSIQNYADSYSITDIKPRGIKGISYTRYQELQLKQYIQQNNGMKLCMDMMATFQSKKTGEEINLITGTRLYNIKNNDDLHEALKSNGNGPWNFDW